MSDGKDVKEVMAGLDKGLASCEQHAGKALKSWHETGKIPGTEGFAKLPEAVQKSYFLIEAAFESARRPAEVERARAEDTLSAKEATGKGVAEKEIAGMDAEEQFHRRIEALDQSFAALQLADKAMSGDKSGLATGPGFSAVKAELVKSMASRDPERSRVYTGLEAQEGRYAADRLHDALDKGKQVKKAEGFIKSVVDAYQRVFDDPSAGAPLAPAGEKVDPVVPKVRKLAETDAEKAAVTQVQKAYLKAMEAQDAFQAGDKDKGLALYLETRREAVKAYHALEKCPDYCPEARKAIGNALSPIERDPKIGPAIAKGKGKGIGG